MLIGLTYDLRDYYRALGFSEEDVAEFDFVETVDAIDNTLKELGFETERIGTITELVPMLAAGKRWDVIFNIAEGVYGIGREAQVPAICDAYKIPYTFSDPCVMSLSLNKELTKRVIRDLGLPTPDFQLVNTTGEIDSISLNFPLFAKPYAEGTGKGINAASVINDKETLKTVCSELLFRYRQPVLIETYLPGREFTAALIGTGNDARVAGVMEVILHDNAEKGVYSYANKENCEELVTYELANDELANLAADLALKSWRGLGCFDAGRIDIRCDSSGNPNFIEVNPLAGLHPEHSDLPIICTKAGIPYLELIRKIMHSCLKRYNLLSAAPKGITPRGVRKANNPVQEKKTASRGKSSSSKRIVILYQKIGLNASEDEKDVLIQRDEVYSSLARLGFEPIPLEMTLDLPAVRSRLLQIKPLKVFNLVESLDGNDRLISIAPALLDSIPLEYTGSSTEAIAVTNNKITAKRIMLEANIPTPAYYRISRHVKERIPQSTYILKAAGSHASAGIDERSIINIAGKTNIYTILKERDIRDREEYFIESFIDGREFNISILNSPEGPEVLSYAEIIFSNFPEGKPHIVDYRAKWEPGSFEYQNTARSFDFDDKDKALLKSLEHHALHCFQIFGLKGYARVDFRIDKAGAPWVLEVNANPCLSSDAGFIAAAVRKGISYDEVIQRILGM